MKKFFTFSILAIFLFLLFFIFILPVFAVQNSGPFTSGRRPEVDYPDFGGIKITQIPIPLPDYIKYIFYLFIGISGFVALGVLIYAGFQYLTSVGKAERMSDARDRIQYALLGLILLFCSWLLLRTINFQLVKPTTQAVEVLIGDVPRGIILCTQQVGFDRAWDLRQQFGSATTPESKMAIRDEFNAVLAEMAQKCDEAGATEGNFKVAYLVPWENRQYGAVLYEDRDLAGNAQIIMPNPGSEGEGGRPTERPIALNNVSSAFIFSLNKNINPNWKVTLYKEQNFNIGVSPDIHAEYPKGGGDWITSIGISPLYSSLSGDLQGHNPESIKIEGNLIAILSKQALGANGYQQVGKYAVLLSTDSDLLDNEEIVDWESCFQPTTPTGGPGGTISTHQQIVNGQLVCPVSKANYMIIVACE